jgi:hypothetical protein
MIDGYIVVTFAIADCIILLSAASPDLAIKSTTNHFKSLSDEFNRVLQER